METISERAAILRKRWEADPRWAGIERAYSAEDVVRLRGPVMEDHTLARLGAIRLWDLLHGPDAIRASGTVGGGTACGSTVGSSAVGGGQAAQTAAAGRMAAAGPAAGPRAVYLSGGQPAMVRRVNKAMLRADPVARPGEERRLAPVVADAGAGSGGVRNAFELMTAMIEAGAAGVRFDDRLGASALVPASQHVRTLSAARLAADVLDVPSLVIARTAVTRRGLEFALYADLLWLEAPAPDLAEARAFARIIHSEYPGKILAYGCPPSCDWRAHLDDADLAKFHGELAAMGYRFQFAGEPHDSHGQHGPHASPGETGYFDLVTRALAPEPGAAALAASLETADFVGRDQVDHHGRLVPGD
jgi:isocitrate lyase